MSLYACNLFQRGKLLDDNCVFGYDEPMQTFFFRSGKENKDGAPIIWLGKDFYEYKLFTELLLKLQKHDFALQIYENELHQLKQEIASPDLEKAMKLLMLVEYES